jgi:hypothetical protein
MHRMPFGKYRGRSLRQIPLSYLCWVLESVREISSSLRAAIRDEIRERLGLHPPPPPPPPPPPSCRTCSELRSRWRSVYRKLVMLVHPDRGGSHDAMILINEVNEWFTLSGSD